MTGVALVFTRALMKKGLRLTVQDDEVLMREYVVFTRALMKKGLRHPQPDALDHRRQFSRVP